MASLKDLFKEWREDEALRKTEETQQRERLTTIPNPLEQKNREQEPKETQQRRDIER